MCKEDGRIPKFSRFLVDNGDGSFSLPQGNDYRSTAIREGYWKTLIDFKMYDNAGNGSQQTVVTPNVNMNEARRILDEYSLERNGVSRKSNNDLPVAQAVVDRYVEEYKANHPLGRGRERYSLSYDSEYLSAVNNGDTRTAQKMVNDAALESGVYTNKNGKPLKLYHGTRQNFGFTRFDTDRAKWGLGAIFTTDNSSVAAGYSEFGNDRGASSKYIPDDGTDETIIRNTKNVMNSDVERLTEEKAEEIHQELIKNYQKLADMENQAMEESQDYYPPADVENEFWDVVQAFNNILSEDRLLFEADLDFRNEYRNRESTQREIIDNNLMEARDKIREYYNNNPEAMADLKENGKGYYKLLFGGYDHGDGIIDLEYSYKPLLDLSDKFIFPETSQIISRSKLQDSLELIYFCCY